LSPRIYHHQSEFVTAMDKLRSGSTFKMRC
jgi:hypothetical protein